MNTITVFTSTDENSTREPSKETRRGVRDAIKNVVEIEVNTLHENVNNFIKKIDDIISVPINELKGFSLDTIEIHANIDQKGNIGIIGIANAEISANGGIKFILKRK